MRPTCLYAVQAANDDDGLLGMRRIGIEAIAGMLYVLVFAWVNTCYKRRDPQLPSPFMDSLINIDWV